MPPTTPALARLSWQWLREHGASSVQPLEEFLAAANRNPTPVADRARILDQASLVIESLYPHFPFKRERFRFLTPMQWFEQNVRPHLAALSETDFHGHVLAAFSLIRDAHTIYGLPSPYRGAIAFLPFQMRFYMDGSRRRYVVTRVMNGFHHDFFRPGAEILEWVAHVPVENYIEAIAGRLPGPNEAAAHARGVFHATIRPLTFVQEPGSEDIPAFIRYLPPGGSQTRTIRIPWGVASGFPVGRGFPSDAFSVCAVQETAAGWYREVHEAVDNGVPQTPGRRVAAGLLRGTVYGQHSPRPHRCRRAGPRRPPGCRREVRLPGHPQLSYGRRRLRRHRRYGPGVSHPLTAS